MEQKNIDVLYDTISGISNRTVIKDIDLKINKKSNEDKLLDESPLTVVEEKGFDHLVIKNENQVYLNQNEN
jgi:hypothetical protein